MSNVLDYVKKCSFSSEASLELTLKFFGIYVSFKWTKITNFSLFIHKLYVLQQFRVWILYIKVIKNLASKILSV